MLVLLARVCIVCVKERVPELQTNRMIQEECKTTTNTIKMMQESLTSKYNKLLSFRHKEVII